MPRRRTPSDLPEAVVLASGRPTLVVPHIGVRAPLGETVLLCWNASRESARAAADALPFLRLPKKVIVLVVDPRTSPDGHGAEPGADVALWLTRHGVKVTVQRDVAADSDVGAVILSRAADLGVDLIVMGVYGHSRVREMVLGGVSRTLLSSMTVPVLIAALMDATTIAAYDRPVPRYTSYPTAAQFHGAVGPVQHRAWLPDLARTCSTVYLHVPFCAQLCWYCACHTSAVNRPEFDWPPTAARS